MQEGTLDLKLDGVWVQAKAGDLVRMPRGIPHGYFNKSDKPVRACSGCRRPASWKRCSITCTDLTDVAEVVRLSAEHEVDFLPEDANA